MASNWSTDQVTGPSHAAEPQGAQGATRKKTGVSDEERRGDPPRIGRRATGGNLFGAPASSEYPMAGAGCWGRMARSGYPSGALMRLFQKAIFAALCLAAVACGKK